MISLKDAFILLQASRTSVLWHYYYVRGGRKSLRPDPRMSKLRFETLFVKSRGLGYWMVNGTKQTTLLWSRPSTTVESIHSSQGQRLVKDGFMRVSLCACYQGGGQMVGMEGCTYASYIGENTHGQKNWRSWQGWQDGCRCGCTTQKSWPSRKSSGHFLTFCLGRVWTSRDEPYGLADRSIDPDLGLYEPIGNHEQGVHPRSKNEDVAD
jgi:hypothetical protein